jgi:RNA polymerase sigma-70 factor (ECF subfamily)
VRAFVVAVGPQLLRVVRRVLGPEHPEVEDITQEAAFGVLDALPRYRGECSVVHFACRVAVLTAMNVRRRDAATKRAQLQRADAEVDSLVGTVRDPERSLDIRQAAEAVRELMAELPEPQAEALGLHCVLGYTVAEIAGAANVSQETVRSRLRLAKRALRERLEGRAPLRQILAEGT